MAVFFFGSPQNPVHEIPAPNLQDARDRIVHNVIELEKYPEMIIKKLMLGMKKLCRWCLDNGGVIC